MHIEKILVVDDDPLIRSFLLETLKRKNIDTTAACDGKEAISILENDSFDMVISDMKMPGATGIDVLKKVKEQNPSTLVLIITAFGTVENAVEAMKLGAFNYLVKPFTPDSIEAIIEKAQDHLSLVAENTYLREETSFKRQNIIQEPIYKNSKMMQILQNAIQAAKSNASVFISGESGTGKEVIAHVIHTNSLRADKPYVKVNCAAIPETLVESEFFGHEKGAFTGANTKRVGRFELANNGTLLLDEITETPLTLQPKLLRVTQEQIFERVGGTKSIKVDVRLITTTNCNIKQAIESRVLREDLYYRLNVIPIILPPLRERRDEIISLSNHFLKYVCIENHKPLKKLSKKAEEKLIDYDWPGNIRELANIIERIVVMDVSEEIEEDHICIDFCSKAPLV